MDIPFLSNKMKGSEMVIMFTSVSFMLSAGLSPAASMEVLVMDEASKINKTGPKAILDSMNDGMSLSRAFKENEDVLGEGYWRQLEAAERTGKLPSAMLRLAEQIKANKGITGKIRGAMAYPAFVMLIALVAAYFMFTKIIPNMADMMSEFGAELPKMTQVMMGFSNVLIDFGLQIIVITVLLVAGFIHMIHNGWRMGWDRFLTRFPLVGPIVVNLNYATMFRITSDMVENGSSQVESVRTAAGSVKNHFISHEMDEACDEMISQGINMAEAFGMATTIPNDDRLLLKVGQRTGRTMDILQDLAVRRQQQAMESVNSLLEMLSPIIMAVVCVIVGAVVVSVYLPMITMSQSIG